MAKNTLNNNRGNVAPAGDSLTQLKHKKMALNPRGLAVDLSTLLLQIPVDPSNLLLSEL